MEGVDSNGGGFPVPLAGSKGVQQGAAVPPSIAATISEGYPTCRGLSCATGKAQECHAGAASRASAPLYRALRAPERSIEINCRAAVVKDANKSRPPDNPEPCRPKPAPPDRRCIVRCAHRRRCVREDEHPGCHRFYCTDCRLNSEALHGPDVMRAASSRLGVKLGASADKRNSSSVLRVDGSLFSNNFTLKRQKMDLAAEEEKLVVGLAHPGDIGSHQQDTVKTKENITEGNNNNGCYIIEKVDDDKMLNPRSNKEGDSRQDFPVLYNKKRGSAGVAVAVAANPARLQEAVNELIKDFYAPGTWRTLKAHWRTVSSILAAAGHSSVTPLTVQKVVEVAAALKKADFRSGGQYLGVMKTIHIEQAHPFTAELELIMRKAEDSLARGLGPADKAPELRLSWLSLDTELFHDLPVVGGPDCYVVAFSWLLREIEVAALMATTQEIIIEENGDVCLVFPVSKADKKGCSVRRTLACICWRGEWEGQRAQAVCGVCAVKRQLERLYQFFGYRWNERSPSDSGLRLFPCAEGHTASKQDMTITWTTCGGGSVEARGHTPRRSGTKALARLGWPLWRIQSLARHSSNAILGYVEESLAERSGDWTRDPTLLQSTAGEELCADTAVLERLDKVEQALADIRSASNTLKGDVDKLEKEFEVAALAAEEFNSFCKNKWRLLEEGKTNEKEIKKEMRVISEDGHFKDKQARTHRVVPGSTSLSCPFWVSFCGCHLGNAKDFPVIHNKRRGNPGLVSTVAAILSKLKESVTIAAYVILQATMSSATDVMEKEQEEFALSEKSIIHLGVSVTVDDLLFIVMVVTIFVAGVCSGRAWFGQARWGPAPAPGLGPVPAAPIPGAAWAQVAPAPVPADAHPEKRVGSRSMAVQAQTTYLRHRACPRFHPLAESAHGAHEA